MAPSSKRKLPRTTSSHRRRRLRQCDAILPYPVSADPAYVFSPTLAEAAATPAAASQQSNPDLQDNQDDADQSLDFGIFPPSASSPIEIRARWRGTEIARIEEISAGMSSICS